MASSSAAAPTLARSCPSSSCRDKQQITNNNDENKPM
jgi:hypothetical protein